MPLKLTRHKGIEQDKKELLELLKLLDQAKKNPKELKKLEQKIELQGAEKAAALMKDLFESLSYSDITPVSAKENKALYDAIAKRWREDIRRDSELDAKFKNDLEVIKKWRGGQISKSASAILESEKIHEPAQVKPVQTPEKAPTKLVAQPEKTVKKAPTKPAVQSGKTVSPKERDAVFINGKKIFLVETKHLEGDNFDKFVKEVRQYAERISQLPKNKQEALFDQLDGYTNMPFPGQEKFVKECKEKLDKGLRELAKPAKSQSTGFFSRLFSGTKKEDSKSQNLGNVGSKIEVKNAPSSQQNPTPTPSKKGFFSKLFSRSK